MSTEPNATRQASARRGREMIRTFCAGDRNGPFAITGSREAIAELFNSAIMDIVAAAESAGLCPEEVIPHAVQGLN